MGSGTAPGNVQFTYAQLEGIWIQANGSKQTAPMAAAIAMAESGGNSTAYNQDSNGSIDRGLWQINSVHGTQSTYDVMGNARAAVAISNNGTTWTPWTTYNTGAYRQFLRTGIPPDMTVPINATNAAGNQPGPTTDAELTSTNCWEPWNWIGCAGHAAGSAISGAAEGVASDILGAITKNILNPLITLVSGVIGMTSGVGLMILGLMFIIVGSETGRKAAGTALSVGALAAGQPEVAAAGAGVASGGVGGGVRAGTSARRTSLSRQQAGAEVEARQGRLIGLRGGEARQTIAAKNAGEQVKAVSRSYQEYQKSYRAYLRARGQQP